MGRLIEGRWSTEWYTPDEEGRFVRGKSSFRDAVRADGSTRFAVEAGRYHLYVSYACPWAHRVLIVRALRGLEDAIPVSVVHPLMGDDGWVLEDEKGQSTDPVNGKRFLREVYTAAQADFTGRVTVPVLWDKRERTIVNNESRDLVRMLDAEFAALATRGQSLCPPHRRERVDATIDAIYNPINNGVYRCGFATSQKAYDEAVDELFVALGQLEGVLSKQRFLCGDALTEADICLFTTLVRFDQVYHGHFKCNVNRIIDYPGLWGFVRDVYQQDGVAATVRFDHIKDHYYRSHPSINPTGIVPRGPALDLLSSHGREGLRG